MSRESLWSGGPEQDSRVQSLNHLSPRRWGGESLVASHPDLCLPSVLLQRPRTPLCPAQLASVRASKCWSWALQRRRFPGDPIQKAPPQRTYWLPPLPVLQPSIWFLSTVRLVRGQPAVPINPGRAPAHHSPVSAAHKGALCCLPQAQHRREAGPLDQPGCPAPSKAHLPQPPERRAAQVAVLGPQLACRCCRGGGTAVAVFAVFKSLVLRSLRA